MKIVFPTLIQLPSMLATSQYTMWMCRALAQHAEVLLYVEKAHRPLGEIYEFYDVPATFQIRALGPLWKPRSFWGARRMARELAVEKADLVYVSDARLLRFLLNFAPECHYVYDAENLPGDLKPFVRCLNSAAAVVCHNRQFRHDLVRIGVKAEKILISQNGVNLDGYRSERSRDALRQELGIPLNKRIVMYTGHFYQWKGVDVLLRAAPLLEADTEVYLVGGKAADVQRAVEAAQGMSWSNVKVLPFQPPAAMPKYQQAADILVLPNIAASEDSSYYTSPLKLFQYMAAGRPIVASDLPSLRAVLDSESACWVAPDDPQALARGIRKALTEQRESARRAQRAREAVKQYTWEGRAANILKFVADLMARPQGALDSEFDSQRWVKGYLDG